VRGAVRAAARGESPFSPKAAGALLPTRGQGATPAPELSAREREVLELVAEASRASSSRVASRSVRRPSRRTWPASTSSSASRTVPRPPSGPATAAGRT